MRSLKVLKTVCILMQLVFTNLSRGQTSSSTISYPNTYFSCVSFTRSVSGGPEEVTNLLNLTPEEDVTHYFRTEFYLNPDDGFLTTGILIADKGTLLALSSTVYLPLTPSTASMSNTASSSELILLPTISQDRASDLEGSYEGFSYPDTGNGYTYSLPYKVESIVYCPNTQSSDYPYSVTDLGGCEWEFIVGCEAFIYKDYDVAIAGLYSSGTPFHTFTFSREDGPNGLFKYAVNEIYTFSSSDPVSVTLEIELVHGERGLSLSLPINHGCTKMKRANEMETRSDIPTADNLHRSGTEARDRFEARIPKETCSSFVSTITAPPPASPSTAPASTTTTTFVSPPTSTRTNPTTTTSTVLSTSTMKSTTTSRPNVCREQGLWGDGSVFLGNVNLIKTYYDCEEECRTHPLCEAFTHYYLMELCLLYHSETTIDESTGCVDCFSGEVECTTCDKPGYCIGHTTGLIFACTRDDCLKACKLDPECNFWSFDESSNNICEMTRDCAPQPSDTEIYGTRYCDYEPSSTPFPGYTTTTEDPNYVCTL